MGELMIITYIGIDPGQNGGIACLCSGLLKTVKMPTDEHDLAERLHIICGMRGRNAVVIEQQIPRPTVFFDPSTRQMKSSILKSTCILYAQYMQIRMALTTLNQPFLAQVPETWQRELGLPHKKQKRSDNVWKNVLKAKAQELFPNHKVTLWNADAILLAEYCRRFHTPSLQNKRNIL